MNQGDKKPITNAHAHVFTHKSVPPFLAKTLVLWPFYYLLHVPTFVRLYKFYEHLNAKKYHTRAKRIKRIIVRIKRFIHQHFITGLIYRLIILWLGLTCFFIFYHFLISIQILEGDTMLEGELNNLVEFLEANSLLFKRPDWLPYSINLILGLIILLLVKSVQKTVLFLLNQVRKFLHLLPGEKTKMLFRRYVKMAKFALYGSQSNIYSRLKRQYPLGSHFILLSMDMKYMQAGSIAKHGTFYKQLEELKKLNRKKEIHSFLFIDPRRIRDKKEGKRFFDYELKNEKITLKESIVKQYLEHEEFAGIKIYPALGYFPFDEDLLPLWKYAADNNIPIMTHGVKGVIYYRGKLLKEWNEHPVFKEFVGNGRYRQILFDEFKNVDFQVNFTHPMNYLCLLEEPLLRILIGNGKSEENKKIFGYTNSETPLKWNLSNLKVCFAHYGGAEEWKKFLERDRDNYAQQLMSKPESGVWFGLNEHGEIPWGRYENVWKYTDWYSIVSSMMIQYENFYADISYIVSDPDLYPMLGSTIGEGSEYENYFTKTLTYSNKNKLRQKVLFGSDFYVVRSQKADKDIFIELKSFLSENDFDLIARENPYKYLNKNI